MADLIYTVLLLCALNGSPGCQIQADIETISIISKDQFRTWSDGSRTTAVLVAFHQDHAAELPTGRSAMKMRVEDVLRRYKEEDLPEFVEIALVDVNQRGNFGNTPLHVASVRGDTDEVEALLVAGADVNARGELGNTPLHDAAGQGHTDVTKLLLQWGASTEATNADGKRAIEVASLMQHHDTVSAIDHWLKSKQG